MSGASSFSFAAISANTRNVEITMPMSAPLAMRMVWPASRASSSASAEAFCLTRSATLSSAAARSRPFIFGHGPSSNALRAAWAALRASSASPLATVAKASPVEGSIESKVSPEAASTSPPPMTS